MVIGQFKISTLRIGLTRLDLAKKGACVIFTPYKQFRAVL
jgi:hypothetical protein